MSAIQSANSIAVLTCRPPCLSRYKYLPLVLSSLFLSFCLTSHFRCSSPCQCRFFSLLFQNDLEPLHSIQPSSSTEDRPLYAPQITLPESTGQAQLQIAPPPGPSLRLFRISTRVLRAGFEKKRVFLALISTPARSVTSILLHLNI